MAAGAHQSLRILFLLLAVANLALLGARLWPWQDALTLPGGGTSALDPALTLLGYLGIIVWLTGARQGSLVPAQAAATGLGVVGGFLLAAEVLLTAKPAAEDAASRLSVEQMGLLGGAGILWGIVAVLGVRAAGSVGSGMMAALWSAIVSCLMASTAVLAGMFLAAAPVAGSQDPWKQYEGLAVGNAATQALVHSLNSATAFLLLGPLLSVVIGLVFAYFGQPRAASD